MSKDKREPVNKRATEENVETASTLPALPFDMGGKISPLLEGEMDEAKRSELAASGRFFGRKEAQAARIMRKLLRFAADGKFEQVFNVLNIRPDLYKSVLFALAGSAEQDKMQVILRKHPELLTEPGPLTDISGAHFESITVFQHAVWAGDVRYMANMMLDCIPNTEAGEQIRLKLVKQYKDLMANSVCYQLNGQTYRETQFSLIHLIEALETYENTFSHKDKPAREYHWCKVVGGAQTRLPANIRHHYCAPNMSLCGKPDFEAKTLVRRLFFYNALSESRTLWCSSLSGLGSNFGIAGSILGEGGRGERSALARGRLELRSIKDLYKVRTEIDGPALCIRMEIPIQTPEKNSQVKNNI